MTTKMNSRSLKALSVVCLHTTLPVVDRQKKRIDILKKQLANAHKVIEELQELREWCDGYNYDEDFDRERMWNGEQPLLNSPEYYEPFGSE